MGKGRRRAWLLAAAASFPVLVEALEFPLRTNSLFCSCGQQQGSNQETLLEEGLEGWDLKDV